MNGPEPKRSLQCGAQTPSEQRRATQWCQARAGHFPYTPHRVWGGAMQVIREWRP